MTQDLLVQCDLLGLLGHRGHKVLRVMSDLLDLLEHRDSRVTHEKKVTLEMLVPRVTLDLLDQKEILVLLVLMDLVPFNFLALMEVYQNGLLLLSDQRETREIRVTKG